MFDKIQQEWMASMAFLYIQQRRYAQAIVLLEALEVLKPEDPYTLKALSLAYLNVGRYKESLHCADTVIDQQTFGSENKYDELASLWLIKSRALWHLDRKELSREAMEHYKQACRQKNKNNHNGPVA